MAVVFFSDVHLGLWLHRRREFREFLDALRSNPPDVLVGVGDLFDLWVRDMSAVQLERNAALLIDTLYYLEDRGTQIVLVVGNHDWHMRESNIDPELAPKWGVMVDSYRFRYDGVEFYVEHGHLCEPGFNPAACEALSYMNDYQGRGARRLWDSIPKPFAQATAVDPLGVSWALANLRSPGSTARARTASIEDCLRRRAGRDAWVIYGHTHVPKLDPAKKIANTGAFEGNVATYLVYDGELRLEGLAGEA